MLAENPETGEVAYKTVLETYENETTELVHVYVNDEEIVTTPSHPFYAPKLGWTKAINLRAGDILVLSNGEYVVVEFIQHEILESPVKVYNFEVEDFHTYFVGKCEVLVHNWCRNPGGRLGSEKHRQKTNEIVSSITDQGVSIVQEKSYVVKNGFKNRRFADVVVIDNETKEVIKIYQVGRVNKDNTPVIRERRAIMDIGNSSEYNGAPIYFVPYNSDIAPFKVNPKTIMDRKEMKNG